MVGRTEGAGNEREIIDRLENTQTDSKYAYAVVRTVFAGTTAVVL